MDIVINILTTAERSKHTTEEMYIFWTGLLVDVDEKSQCLESLTKALKTYNQSVMLWQKYLLLKAESTGNVNHYFFCFLWPSG